ncbi:unnamed protein product [Gongylonema pulchrum]|uniref:NABP domain-containing protein n=1 Tax=Gongylonema pulchrum TaxID=637853 RepID=A0A183DEM2_9BILA|nr:unnamed protein product [Gongylonema pulchrum]
MGGEGFRSFSKYGDKTRVGYALVYFFEFFCEVSGVLAGVINVRNTILGMVWGFITHVQRQQYRIQEMNGDPYSGPVHQTILSPCKLHFGRGDSRGGFMNSAGSNAFQSNTSSIPPTPYSRGTAHNNFSSPTHNIAGDRWNGGINSQHGR